MSDLIERLRGRCIYTGHARRRKDHLDGCDDCKAADEIERLTLRLKRCGIQYDKYDERIAKLEAALERSCTCQVYGMTPICAACDALEEAKK